MSILKNEMHLDLDSESHHFPAPKYVSLLMRQAIDKGADEIIFFLEDGANTALPEIEVEDLDKERILESKFHTTILANGTSEELSLSPSFMFPGVVRVFCNYASVPYHSKGHIEGKITIKDPPLTFLLKSDNLNKTLTLTRI
jgi:hypothetical protein